MLKSLFGNLLFVVFDSLGDVFQISEYQRYDFKIKFCLLGVFHIVIHIFSSYCALCRLQNAATLNSVRCSQNVWAEMVYNFSLKKSVVPRKIAFSRNFPPISSEITKFMSEIIQIMSDIMKIISEIINFISQLMILIFGLKIATSKLPVRFDE